MAPGPRGRFTHELIVPFVRVFAVARSRLRRFRASTAPASAARRSFPPGWWLCELYGPSSAADRVIG
jgi:hypothetical protein